jgi:hypothetical protein
MEFLNSRKEKADGSMYLGDYEEK